MQSLPTQAASSQFSFMIITLTNLALNISKDLLKINPTFSSPNLVQITECSESDTITAVMSAWWSPDLVDKTLWLFSIQFIPGYYQADIDRETLLTGSDEIFLVLMKTLLFFSSSGHPRRGSAKRRQTTARTSWTPRIRWENISFFYLENISVKIFH